jgi:hypothetical protein
LLSFARNSMDLIHGYAQLCPAGHIAPLFHAPNAHPQPCSGATFLRYDDSGIIRFGHQRFDL